jgi:hypothetical protein
VSVATIPEKFIVEFKGVFREDAPALRRHRAALHAAKFGPSSAAT